nr:hypothetical protein [Angustibacter aerolatus]
MPSTESAAPAYMSLHGEGQRRGRRAGGRGRGAAALRVRRCAVGRQAARRRRLRLLRR